MKSVDEIRLKTQEDFGDQWSVFQSSNGHYGSPALLQDLFGDLLDTQYVKNKTVLDIGSGSGRICEMLLKHEATKVFGLEPSLKAFQVLKNNLRQYDNFVAINADGDSIPQDLDLDLITSIGVIHHIKNPISTLISAHRALKPGGKLLIWVYGREGNIAYLTLFRMIHPVTTRISHESLLCLCKFLLHPLKTYGFLCKFLPLPMSSYFKNVINKWSDDVKILTIYDQLNPRYAKYYTKKQICDEVEKSGFINVKAYHRHGYSWTVTGTKA